jgi:hypothetical protein
MFLLKRVSAGFGENISMLLPRTLVDGRVIRLADGHRGV